ncbi:chemotaxis response regulator protein-glutamate methylesterase [Sphingobacteriaceae bacterium]|nr:chemotaxis response regulator protein-glutamate methylesterase [Sphingobacteriaceae bacterium]
MLIADDSVFMRILIKDILEGESQIQVIAQAKDGKEAAALCALHKPDVVLLDMTMGEYDGIYGVKKIMESCATPIIILSALGNTDMSPVMEALSLGAIDYLNKPANNNSNIREVGEPLIRKVKEASEISLAHPVKIDKIININPHSFIDQSNFDIIVIGSSTGGPTAVEKVITNLPGNLNIPVLIAQHMPSNFVPSFASRLDALTPLSVSMARKDDIIEKGKILIAPGSRNIIVRRENDKVLIDYTHQRYKEFNFPSVTGLMLSVAQVYGSKSIGVILTGMGKDGVEGMKAIYESGGYTIAQNQESCVVYGMPRAAVEEGCIRQIVPLNEIGGFLTSCLS